MAEPVSYFLQVKAILDMGKAVYDRVQTVKSFKKSSKQLGERLNMALKIVQEIRDLEKERKLLFETSGIFKSIGLAFERLHRFILKADEFTKKLAGKAPWKTFITANDIKGKFESLNKALSCFQADMDNTLQVNAVRESAEISEMLRTMVKPHLTKLKDSEHNCISAITDDFKAVKDELEDLRQEIQQGMCMILICLSQK